MWLFKIRGFRIYCVIGVIVAAIVLAVAVLLCSLDEQLLNSELILSAILALIAGALWPVTLVIWVVLVVWQQSRRKKDSDE